MIARVLISKQLLSNFRKKALSIYPNEYMMTVWGRIEGDTVQVESLREVAQKATEGSVTASFLDCVTSSNTSTFLGTIHTHPDSTDATPSQADWDGSFACGEYIFGIMKISKGKTITKWWEPRAEISMIHPRVRAEKKHAKVEVIELREVVVEQSL